MPVGSDGAVTDPAALAEIAASSAFADARRGSSATIAASSALAEPITVSVVPPGALYGVQGRKGCVVNGSGARPVEIIGSELGQSFVRFRAGEPPSGVVLSPERPPACK